MTRPPHAGSRTPRLEPSARDRALARRASRGLARALAVLSLWPAAPAGAEAPPDTFEKHLARAERGNPDSQNLLGVMYFLGDGAAEDPTTARRWFAAAARQGHAGARRNLAALDRLSNPPDAPAPASTGSGEPPRHLGEPLYTELCASCHGRHGIAGFPKAPSFALGETLDKSTTLLLYSMRDGPNLSDAGPMPTFHAELTLKEMTDIIGYLRVLRRRYEQGIEAMSGRLPPPLLLEGSPREAADESKEPARSGG